MSIEITKKKEMHLIKLDIDGTSTNADFSTLNQNLKKVLQKLKEQGHKICFTTGRNYLSALPFYQEVGLDTFLVTYNGAYINNPSDKNNREIVNFNPIKNEIVKDILNEPIIKENIKNALIDHVNGFKKDGEIDLRTISTSDDIYYQEIFFNGNPYVKIEEEVIEDEVTSFYDKGESDLKGSFNPYQIGTKKNGRLLYDWKKHGKKTSEEKPQIGQIKEKWFFSIDTKTKGGDIKISDFKKRKEELTLNPSKILQLLGEKDALQLVLELPKSEEVFKEVLLVLRRKYNNAIDFYFGSKLKAKNPGDKVLVPDPERKIIKIRDKSANKGMGAAWVASKYNVGSHNIIAFGNDVNDIELVHSVGKGVVTADSNDYLKTRAYGITDFGLLNSDGVANFLVKYFKIK